MRPKKAGRVGTAVLAMVLGAGSAAVPVTPAVAVLPTCDHIIFINKFQGSKHLGAARIPVKVVDTVTGTTFQCQLGRGNAGWVVEDLQRALNRCYNAGLTVDGNFGAQTEAAIIWLQWATGLTQDGIYGPATKNKMMFPFYASGTRPSTSPSTCYGV